MFGFFHHRTKLLFVVGIILVTFSAYYPAIRGDYIWDDDNYVTNNRTLRSIQGLKDIWFKPDSVPQYYPLVHTTFWVEFRLWSLDPLGYHVVNVLFHVITAILFWALFSKLGLRGAWLMASIFALHPVHVESVAWITERKNVLSAFFYASSLLTFLRFVDVGKARSMDQNSGHLLYVLSLFLYVCALLSKTVTCSLPVVIAFVLWWRDGAVSKRCIMGLLPFMVLGIVFGLFTVYLEKYHVGAQGHEWDISFLKRCLIAGCALWFYLGKIVWPSSLTFIYPRWEFVDVWRSSLFPIGFLLLLMTLYIKRKTFGRGPFVAFTIFAITLFPALGFFDVYPMRYSFVADHFQYLASIPIICLVVSSFFTKRPLMALGSQRYCRIQLNRPLQFAALGCVLSILSLLTWQRCHAFQSAEKLWVDTIVKNPKAWMAHNNLGLHYAENSRPTEAIYHYKKAISLKPDHANAYNNLAMAWEKLGNDSLAKQSFAKALQLEPNNVRVLNNYGNFFARRGKLVEAKSCFQRALKFSSSSPDVLTNLGNLHAQNQEYEQAISYYSQVLSNHPNHVFAHFNLANVLSDQKRTKEAVVHYRQALKNKPNFKEAKVKLRQLLVVGSGIEHGDGGVSDGGAPND